MNNITASDTGNGLQLGPLTPKSLTGPWSCDPSGINRLAEVASQFHGHRPEIQPKREGPRLAVGLDDWCDWRVSAALPAAFRLLRRLGLGMGLWCRTSLRRGVGLRRRVILLLRSVMSSGSTCSRLIGYVPLSLRSHGVGALAAHGTRLRSGMILSLQRP